MLETVPRPTACSEVVRVRPSPVPVNRSRPSLTALVAQAGNPGGTERNRVGAADRIGLSLARCAGTVWLLADLVTRLRSWALDGTFSCMLRAVQAGKDAAEDNQWSVPTDSTIVRAHQHAAGGKRGGGRPGRSG
jgi:hypothetical protein